MHSSLYFVHVSIVSYQYVKKYIIDKLEAPKKWPCATLGVVLEGYAEVEKAREELLRLKSKVKPIPKYVWLCPMMLVLVVLLVVLVLLLVVVVLLMLLLLF